MTSPNYLTEKSDITPGHDKMKEMSEEEMSDIGRKKAEKFPDNSKIGNIKKDEN